MPDRLPLAPVLEWTDGYDRSRPGEPSSLWLCDFFGVSTRRLSRWRAEGLDCWEADTVAVRLGRPGRDLWGSAFDDCADATVEAVLGTVEEVPR